MTPNPTRHFQRFNAPDINQWLAEIEQVRQALGIAQQEGDTVQIIEHAGALGSMLTTARKEREAREMLEPLLPLATEHSTTEPAAWFLLALATANQYLDDRVQANEQFAQALEASRQYGWQKLEHYVLHHLGRSLVEEGDLQQAKVCLLAALAIREALNEPRQTSTRSALVELDQLLANCEQS